jgi:deoxyribodipyrimidine photo-lyase
MFKVFWFRKDLRLIDNRALSEFVKSINKEDSFFFIYIINKSSFKFYNQKRISFLYECLSELKNDLKSNGLELNIIQGKSIDVFKILTREFGTMDVYVNEQVEHYCINRDDKVTKLVQSKSGNFYSFRDTTSMDINKVIKNDSLPYTVYTPFKNKLLKLLSPLDYEECKVNLNKLNPAKQIEPKNVTKYDFIKEYDNLVKSDIIKGGRTNALKILETFCKNNINNYHSKRNFPAESGTSLLSAHLHFGTINIRECFRTMSKLKNKSEGIEKWRDELIWREFYYNIAYNFPYIENGSFKKEYDNLKWNYDKKLFKLWCEGKTGFPIVDAGMRQLKKEGWMHNRVRMIVAMFLSKDLLIDWKFGEKYFEYNLIDFDFSSNNGGWQWSASTGCDAQPYFRIFNPFLQSKKYDPYGVYIKKYVSELKNVSTKYIHNPSEMPLNEQNKCNVIIGKDYPVTIVNHSEVSKLAIEMFRNIRNKHKNSKLNF